MWTSRMPSGDPEIFATVQGEGASIGVPSVFVRLGHCNLRCTWCDTAYTWDWSRYDREREIAELDVDAIFARALTEAGPSTRNMVITGGEPLVQADEVAELARRAHAAGFRVEVETNGTVQPGPELAAVVDQWNVSPKLAGSGNEERLRVRPQALTWFARQDNAWFKLVVANEEDLAEATALVARFEVPPARVILMPEGTSASTIAERSRWLADRCRAAGYRLGTRLHLFVWGSERGR